MLRDWELTAARDAMVDQTLDARCTITRYTGADDEYGGQATATTTVASDVPCRVHGEPIFGRYAQGVEGTVPLFLVSLPYGVDVRPQDNIAVGTTNLAVMRVVDPETWALVTQVECSTGVR